jgi:squalene monooxygenase
MPKDGGEPETIVQNIYAPITIVADGCFSKFRAQPGLKLPTPKTRSHFVGVILKDLRLPLPRHGTVCLTPEGPVLFYQIADKGEETRMLVDVKGKLPSVADGSLKVSFYALERCRHELTSRITLLKNTSPTFLPNYKNRSSKQSRISDYEPCPIPSSLPHNKVDHPQIR